MIMSKLSSFLGMFCKVDVHDYKINEKMKNDVPFAIKKKTMTM